MKKLFVLLFLFLCVNAIAQSKKKRILIFTEISNNTCQKNAAEAVAATLPDELASLLRKELPCFEVVLKSDLITMLKFDRARILAGYQGESEFENIIENFKCDYFILLQISCINSKIMITGTRNNSTKLKVENRYSKIGNNDNGELVTKFAQDFLENILYSEPCPYKGNIKIENLEITAEDTISEKNISCGNLAGTSGIEKYTSKEKRNISRKIELNKIKRLEAEGSYTSEMTSEYLSTYMNQDCYVCSMDGTDATVITTGDFSDEVTEHSKWSISGIASYKFGQDSLITTSEVAIHFAKNGTYTLEIKAVSEYGKYEGNRIRKSNSTCAGQTSKKDDPVSYKINDKVKFTLGPFKGSPFDKELKENGTKEFSEKNGKSKNKINYNFSFSRI